MEPKLIQIKSNGDCLGFLRRADQNGKLDDTLRHHPILAPWFDRIRGQIDPVSNTLAHVLKSHSNRQVATFHLGKCANSLKVTTRDFKLVLKHLANRLEKPEMLSHYKMPHKGAESSVSEDWYQTALWLVEGEKVATAKGFPAMSNPSVADLRLSMEAYRQGRIEADHADREYQAVQAEMSVLRRQTQISARGLYATIRLILDDKKAATVRRTLRGFGYRFRGEVHADETLAVADGNEREDKLEAPADAKSMERNNPTERPINSGLSRTGQTEPVHNKVSRDNKEPAEREEAVEANATSRFSPPLPRLGHGGVTLMSDDQVHHQERAGLGGYQSESGNGTMESMNKT